MPETDSKYRFVFLHDTFNGNNSIIHSRGIAGAIGNKIAGWPELLYFFQFCFCRKYFYIGAALYHAIKNMLLDPVIHYSDPDGRILVTFFIGIFRAYMRRQFQPIHIRNFTQFLF